MSLDGLIWSFYIILLIYGIVGIRIVIIILKENITKNIQQKIASNIDLSENQSKTNETNSVEKTNDSKVYTLPKSLQV